MATKSKYALINSFLDLLQNNSYDKITVTRLVEECGVSRQTFYYHFDDIEKMIFWAIKNETENIMNNTDSENYDEIARLFADFLKKYIIVLQKASESVKFIAIYNYLFENTNDFLKDFILKKHKKMKNAGDEAEFFISYSAGAFCSLVVSEMQKDQPDYDELMRKLVKVLKTV